jgi:hypothetical protein
MERISRRDADGDLFGLDELTLQVRSKLWELSESLTAHYFHHLTTPRLAASP